MTIAVTHRRISMGDVDQVMAFYGRYFSWMDDGLCELLRVLGHPLSEVLGTGHGMPVVDSLCRYGQPVALDDTVRVETAVVSTRRTSLDIGHVMTVDGTVVGQGRTTHVWVTRAPELQPQPVPVWLREAVALPSGFGLPPAQ